MASQMQIIEHDGEMIHGLHVVQRIESCINHEILVEGTGKVYPENVVVWQSLLGNACLLRHELNLLIFKLERATK